MTGSFVPCPVADGGTRAPRAVLPGDRWPFTDRLNDRPKRGPDVFVRSRLIPNENETR
jgi:hypothetical protein